MPALPTSGNHFIVCGDGSLAYRIADELREKYHAEVVLVLPREPENPDAKASIPRDMPVLTHGSLNEEAFADARIGDARALALVGSDDLVNFHAALRAEELNPGLRIVVAAFNERLGGHIRPFFRDCTVLSSSQMAAPAFVAAALSEPEPSHVRVSGRTLYLARRSAVPADQVVCGLGVPDDTDGTPQLIAPETLRGAADDTLVLAVADGTPRDPLASKRHPVRAAARMAQRLVWNRFGTVFTILLAAMVAGFILLHFARYSVSNQLYLTIMSMTGSALTGSADNGAEKWSQVILTVDGMALIPVVTALIVGSQLTGSVRANVRPRGGHVIVVGLGRVGTRVIGELHDLGYDVACIDRDPQARGVALARRLRMPLVIGEAYREETLRAAGLPTAIALVSVTSSDMVNLETALQARELRQDLRLVLRLGDDDLAKRVQKTLGAEGEVTSGSVSYMAAPAFAAALLENQVLRTIAVGRHVLLIAGVEVREGAEIAGQALAELEGDGLARVLALQVRGAQRYHWSPHHGHLLAAGDRVIVLATRAGLTRFLTANPIINLFGVSRTAYQRVTLLAELSTWVR